MRLSIAILNLITLFLLGVIATNPEVNAMMLVYILTRVPILVWDSSIMLYVTEEHVVKNLVGYILRIPKRLILFYEYQYVLHQFKSIEDNTDFELERHRDSKIVSKLMSYLDGTAAIQAYNKHINKTKTEQQKQKDKEYVKKLRNFGKSKPPL